MQVVEVMIKDVKTIRVEDSVKKAAEIMKEHDIGALIVLDGSGSIVGITTERDIILDVVAEGKDTEKTTMEQIMSKKVITISADKTLEDAADLMTENDIRRLPVVYEGNLVGIVSASDLIVYEKHLIEKLSKLFSLSPQKKIAG